MSSKRAYQAYDLGSNLPDNSYLHLFGNELFHIFFNFLVVLVKMRKCILPIDANDFFNTIVHKKKVGRAVLYYIHVIRRWEHCPLLFWVKLGQTQSEAVSVPLYFKQ